MEIPSFADGLGRRTIREEAAGDRSESLRVCQEIALAPSTQAALVERTARLSEFQHPAFARVRRVERLTGVTGGLAVVSDAVDGVRLSDVLRRADRSGARHDGAAALCIVQQISAALAALHAFGRDASHGTLGPERVVMKTDGTAVVGEYVFASALEQLQLSRARLWSEFRIPVPTVAGTARFDQQTDVMQLGVLALAVLLGRPLRQDDFPQHVPALLEELSGEGVPKEASPGVARPIRAWLVRTLQIDPRSAFRTAIDADAGLKAALVESRIRRPSASGVQALVSRCSVEREPAGRGAESRPSSHGAVVIIPPRPGRPSEMDGSAGFRARRGNSDTAPSIRVLADVSGQPEPPTPAARAAVASPRLPRPAGMRPAEGRWAALSQAVRLGLMVFGLVLLFGASYLGARAYLRVPERGPQTGTLVIDTRPAGAELLIDGQPNGRTPMTLELAAGDHTLELVSGRSRTLVPVTIVAGTRTERRIEVRAARASRRAARPREVAGK